MAIIQWHAEQEEKEPKADYSEDFIGEELADLQADMAGMITPSWTSNLPSNLGDVSCGKLKADHWCLLAKMYLLASLIWLWAQMDDNDTDPKSLLEVTMLLFLAISIVTGHSTSKSKAQLYLQHYQAYISRVKELYPDYAFHPNHHMAFHLAEYLEMYGPVHSWWTFPFERMIGMLQQIPTNNKI
ncbi:hypothetical protein FA15DRAFT_604854, partial [Coprinopsis marcescibilis]